MSLTDRDRKILILLVPAVLLVAYWFLALAPKRDEASKLGEKLAGKQKKLDDARASAAERDHAKEAFASDYATIVRLGKAIPATLDTPSLIVQLDTAAKGTGIRFKHVAAGAREAGQPPTPAASSGDEAAADAGGEDAQTGPGKAAENADETKDTANERAGENADEGSTPSNPLAGASSADDAGAGLDKVPLEFTFRGDFFDLTDFFHRMKRFVRVANGRVHVHGRLLTIDQLTFTTQKFPNIEALVKATVYLAPKEEGLTAGATPAGPADSSPTSPVSGTQPASPAAPPSPSPSAPPTSPTPSGQLR